MDALISRLQNARISDLSSPVSELITENSRVYLHYDVTNPPLHPGPEFTRFVCISDNHGATPRVPRGDVLIHSGDLSMYARKKSRDATMTWLKALPHPVKLVIAGNHDRMLDPEIYEAEGDPEHYQNMRSQLVGDAAVAAKINYLQFESAIIPPASWKAFGSPSWGDGNFSQQATPWYSAGAFQYYENEAQAVNSLIPEDTQILLTHGPPKGILDQSKRGKSVGCPELTRRLFGSTSPRSSLNPDNSEDDDGDYAPEAGGWLPHVRLHVFGHIHEAWGAQIVTRHPPSTSSTSSSSPSQPHSTTTRPVPIETVFVNAAVQKSGTFPIIVDLRKVISTPSKSPSRSASTSSQS